MQQADQPWSTDDVWTAIVDQASREMRQDYCCGCGRQWRWRWRRRGVVCGGEARHWDVDDRAASSSFAIRGEFRVDRIPYAGDHRNRPACRGRRSPAGALQEMSEMDQAGSETPLWWDIAMAHSPDAMSSLAVRLNTIDGASSDRTDDFYLFQTIH